MTSEQKDYYRKLILEDCKQFPQTLLMMAGIADRNLTMAIRAVIERDKSLGEIALNEDSQLDNLEIEVDELVVSYMATHGPIATSCRLLVTASKISSYLEIIGNQAKSIARRWDKVGKAIQYDRGEFEEMARDVVRMMRDSINAFIEVDIQKAHDVIHIDQAIDDRYHEILVNQRDLIAADIKNLDQALNFMHVVRSIERCADSSKHIAQEVHYLYTAEDIRHPQSRDFTLGDEA